MKNTQKEIKKILDNYKAQVLGSEDYSTRLNKHMQSCGLSEFDYLKGDIDCKKFTINLIEKITNKLFSDEVIK